MPAPKVDTTSNHIPLGMMLTGSILCFMFLIVRLFRDFIETPILQANDTMPDFLVVLCFPLSALTYCVLMLYQLRYPAKCSIDSLATIILVWASTVPFVYFQFYHDNLFLYIFMFVIFFNMARLVSSMICLEAPAYKWLCIQFAISCCLPALYATVKTSACRYAMVSAFFKYLRYSMLGSLLNAIMQRLGLISQTSQCLVQSVIIGTSINYSGVLLQAYMSERGSPAHCESWVA